MICVRKIYDADGPLLYLWRNRPEVYRFFFNPRPVTQEEHEKWFYKILNNAHVLFLMGLYQNNECGTVRFDFNPEFDTAEVGIYIIPEFFGRGIGGQMLLQGEKYLQEHVPQIKKLIAKVQVENQSSLKMFSKCLYEEKFVQFEKSMN